MRVRFGPYAFDRQSRLLWREDTEVALPPRVLGVLELLIDRAGQVVARQDLLDGVWKDAFVTDTSLAEAVSFLRQALGDDPQAPRYIQTVHRRGYRFLSPVHVEAPTGGLPPQAAPWGLTPEAGAAGGAGGLTPGTAPAEPGGARPAAAAEDDPGASRVWQFLPLAAAAASAVALLAAAIWGEVRSPDANAPPIARFEIQPAAGTAFDVRGPALAVSPDGRTLAWSACDPAATCGLYVRPIDRLTPLALSGTAGASSPFFSPDGRWIGFFADGKLKKIAAAGGSASILADAPAPGGAAWAADGRIAFNGTRAGGIAIVSDEGGPVAALTSPRPDRGEVRHLYPEWLPSGGLMFTAATSPLAESTGDLAAIASSGHDWQTLRAGVTRAVLAAPAYLLLSSGSDLQAVTFAERSLTLTGGSDSVLATVSGAPLADFATGGGTLLAIPAGGAMVPRWSDGGNADGLARLSSITIAPDSRRAAGVIAESGGSDIWIVDLGSGAASRITYTGVNVSPVWSPDGSRLIFATRTKGAFTLASRALDDRAVAPIATSHTGHLFPSSVAPDGRIAATTASDGHTAIAIVAPGGSVELLNTGPFDEGRPVFSPDSRWLAFESAESGRTEILVRQMAGGRRIAISLDGGLHPTWAADGRAIFFESTQGLMRAGFDPDRGLVSGRELTSSGPVIAITPSGRVLTRTSTASAHGFVILQWLRDLRQRLPLPTPTPR